MFDLLLPLAQIVEATTTSAEATTMPVAFEHGARGLGMGFSFCCWGSICLLAPLLLAFWIWMLVEVVTKEPSEGNDRLVWLLIIILVGWIGALIYYFARRPQRIRQYGR